MDLMEKVDLDYQMTVLQGATMEEEGEEEEEAPNVNDEVEQLSNSLSAIVREEIVKPKLQCLMMDPAFSMVTVQSEDSGILWETVSSRCSTPWTSEITAPAPHRWNSLVPRFPPSPGSETAGRITIIMDEGHMIRRKKKRNKAPEKLPMITDEVPEEPDRLAMVEVSVPNVTAEKEQEDEMKDLKEAKKQRLFRLVSEGSEILNIVVPPKVSTVDEEESKALVDNLSYLEDTPVIKASEFPEEPEEIENPEDLQATVQVESEPTALPPLIQPAQKESGSEDYFETFSLLDHQAPSGVPTVDTNKEPETTTEQEELYKGEDNETDGKPALQISEDCASTSGPEITEHVDEVFYGGGQDPNFVNTAKWGNKDEQPKSPLKKSGCDLFGSQESILTPIFLPEGPQKIIDLVLLEEPKAMAFMYSDLYADAVGSRKKQDDTESVTSEKSFHSQESDIEDRGYLEKFVLKDETPVTVVEPLQDDCNEFGAGMWSQNAFGLIQKDKDDRRTPDDVDEITDFFRNSANSSPCEPIQLHQEKPEETKPETKTRRVVFKDEQQEKTTEEDPDIAEAFLPLDIDMDSLALQPGLQTADYKSVITEYAAKTCAATPSKISSKAKPPKHDVIPIHVPQSVKPVTPRYKPFLELTPLLPVEMPEEDGQQDMKANDEVSSSIAKGEQASAEGPDYEQITEQKAKGSAESSQHYDAVEADNETVTSPVS